MNKDIRKTSCLGTVPHDWKTNKIKYCVESHQSGEWGEEESPNLQEEICIRVADFDYDKLNIKDIEYTKRYYSIAQIKKYRLQKGDLLLEKSGGGELTPVGRVVLFDKNIKAIYANFIEALRFSNKHDSRYFNYVFSTMYAYGVNTLHYTQTTGIQNLRVSSYLDEFAPIPANAEQEVIADFLDNETNKIDSIIADIENQIEILKTYRKTIITETVTKGLNKADTMRDSGYKWIGDIPKRWGLNKIRYVVKVRTETGQYTADDKFIGLENIESETGEYVTTNSEYDNGVADIYKKGDVLFSKLRPYLAKSYITKDDGFCTGEFVIIKEFSGDKRYLFYYFLSSGFIATVDASTYGTKMPRANWDYIKNLAIPDLDEGEQKLIADFLDVECDRIDATLNDKKEALETIKEYKKSVIYEYITGKKRVKEAK